MRRILHFLILAGLISCGRGVSNSSEKIITVSIAPFRYFIDEIGGTDFKVNVMVPAGADPHTYEPFPEQIIQLRKSIAYISNGYLGFEMNWLDRFYEINPTMEKLSLGDKIDPLGSAHIHKGGHIEVADPHYWVSPQSAVIMAASVRNLLCTLNPSGKAKYETNYDALVIKIKDIDTKALNLFSGITNRSFMIYHPNLAYLARDYNLEEIPVEYEGKEPPPSRIRELIDLARKDKIKVIFVQREYDTKNARAIAGEIGARIEIIDPLSADWQKETIAIITALHDSMIESMN
jgi:zinc transport system substrate-binding protein